MLVLTFILLVSFGVISDSKKDEYCNQRRPAHCFTDEAEEELPSDFPDTVEALNKICPILIPRLKCLADYINECRMKRTFSNIMEEKLEIIHNFTVEACDKESKLQQELSVSLPCIVKVSKSHDEACMPMIKEALDEIASHISIEMFEGNLVLEEDLSKYYCFVGSLKLSCLVASTSVTCGDRATNLLEDFLDRIQILDNTCDADIYDEVKAAVAIVQIEMEKRLENKEII